MPQILACEQQLHFPSLVNCRRVEARKSIQIQLTVNLLRQEGEELHLALQ